ncbi:alpha/beta fold hydrolase [Flexivirga alba]|uniref:Alpha/beta fold hydrolase n=1 Tax=Flexivirga alba TaxID=702742 RepID=A0ABW2AEL8_9MICO
MRRVPVRIGRGMTEKGHRAAAFGRHADPADVHDATVIARGTRVNVVAGFYQALMEHDEVSSLSGMQNVPAQVLVGSRDRLTPPKLAQRIAAGLPQAELQTFDDLGHMLPWEAPDRVAKAIEDLAR